MTEIVIRETPSNFMVELTNRCHLHCITCPREYAPARETISAGAMPLDTFKGMVDRFLHKAGSLGLTGGGETLLYRHLKDAVDYALTRNPEIGIFVSTSLLAPSTAEIVSFLRDRIATLQVSVDGTGEAYETVRRGARFADLLANLESCATVLQGSSTKVTFNAVLVRENVGELTALVDLARRFGVDQVSVTPINLVFHVWGEEYYDLFFGDEVQQALGRARAHAEAHGIAFDYLDITALDGFRSCPFPWDNFYITWDGFLVPCCAKPAPRLLNFGNVSETDFMTCLNHPGFVEFRERSLRNEAPEFCRKCHFLVASRPATGAAP